MHSEHLLPIINLPIHIFQNKKITLELFYTL